MIESHLGTLHVEEKRELLKVLLSLQQGSASGLVPLSIGQQSLWFLHQLAPNSPAYNFLYAARIRAALDEGVFHAACRLLAERHPLLRTRFVVQDHKPMQQVDSRFSLEIATSDASSWSECHLLEVIRAHADVPFDLARAPSLRIELFRRGPRQSVLLIVIPHIIADLWSADLLLQELSEMYASLRDNRKVALPPLTAQFTDFVRWQALYIYGELGRRSKQYWHNLLAGELPVLELPTRGPRPPVQTYIGAAHSWPLAPQVVRHVRALAKEKGATPFMTLLAAFQVLLHRLSGQEDILLGTVVAGRDRPEWERVVGYFLNQVVIRTRFNSCPSFRHLLDETRDQVCDAMEHQAYPFGLLVKQLQPKRDPAHAPIFQVMFIWDKPRHLATAEAGGSGLPLEILLMEQRGAPFDLTLIIFETGDGLAASFRYNTDLFDATTIRRWAECFNVLLESLLNAPDLLISELPLLCAAERQRILVEWNRTRTDYPRSCFPEMFEQQVQKTPAAPALCVDNICLSYDELNRQSNQLARYLRNSPLGRAVCPGVTVAISLPRGADVIVAILAVWKAGATYLFVDPLCPPKRREDILAEARPALVIGQASEAEQMNSLAIPLLDLDSARPEIQGEAVGNLDMPLHLDSTAYVIYTSGSAGQPKGVMLRHGGLCNLALAEQQALDIKPCDRVLQFSSFTFDASVWELVGALGSGATLVLGGQADLLPGRPLADFLRDQAITCVTLPPSILAMLPAEPLPALRILVVAGEACSARLVAAWGSGRRFINAYGPTEATVCATLGECFGKRAGAESSPTIGKPIANTRVYVLDRYLEPVPVGVSGELYLAGPGLAQGYVNKPDLTAERFLPNPFDQADDGMMYRTGDMVRWTVDGELEFQGRADNQVKVRGCRIELDEIREVLRGHPDVADAVVTAKQNQHEMLDLVAYVVPRVGADLSQPALRDSLRQRLPHYMLPAVIVLIEALPVGSTGKIDCARLPGPTVDDGIAATPPLKADHALRTPLERLLAQIWGRVLIVSHVGPHDNFFDLGGASTQTLEVVDLAREQGVTLSPDMLFRYQTVAELAGSLQANVEGHDDADKRRNGDEEIAGAASTVGLPAPSLARVGSSVKRDAPSHESPACDLSRVGSVVESLGAYLPEQVVTTDEILKGCRTKIDFPLERLTGIRSRRVAGANEFSIDLAVKAVAECLRRSACSPGDIDLVICCNISRLDGPMYQFSLEPASAARICQRFGLGNAVAMDLTNACAGTFTATLIADTYIRRGLINRAMIVSGEYITHLTRTAQQEIDNFMDSRMACLTLGDSGVAFILERAPHAGVGFQDVELYTLGKYHDLCVAKLSTVAGSGPIMYADAVTGTAVTIKQAVSHALEVVRRKQWELDKIDALVIHQTSETTLDGAVREINRALGKTVCHRGNTIYNVAERGNTATNTHFLAVWERMLAGDFKAGDRTVFSVSGSGQAVGTALYIFDDLPNRLRQPRPPSEFNGHAAGAPTSFRHFRFERRVRIESIGTLDRPADQPAETVAMVCQAGEACLRGSNRPREEIDLIMHTGVYRSEFISEPAVAAIAAGRMAINHDENHRPGRRTLAFDLLNSAAGTLTACFLAAGLMTARRFSHPLILASEVDLNRPFWPDNPIGLEETASALLLEESTSVEGFAAFAVRAFPEHVAAIARCTGVRDNKPVVLDQSAPELENIVVDCVRQTVNEFLAKESITLEDVALVVPPQRTPSLVNRLAEALNVPPRRLLTLNAARDYYTSSLAYAFQKMRREGLSSAGKPALFIEIAAGLQVWCALYYS